MNKTHGNRWYDSYPDLSIRIEKIKNLNKNEKNKIILAMKDIIIDYDYELLNRYVIEFPMTYNRRWYDKDPFSWLTINGLKHANKELLNKIITYLKKVL